MLSKIKRWSARFLSIGGREVFIKSVLQVIPTYSMTCFLLPKSFFDELESIMGQFWWQKTHEKCDIHWCECKKLGELKEDGGMGFRSLLKFNLAMLEKQGWHLICYPDSLLAESLKAKFYLNSNFLNANLGNLPSYT